MNKVKCQVWITGVFVFLIVAMREMNYINTRNFNVTTLLCSYFMVLTGEEELNYHMTSLFDWLWKKNYFISQKMIASCHFVSHIQRLGVSVLS